jgi:hypothetical protein
MWEGGGLFVAVHVDFVVEWQLLSIVLLYNFFWVLEDVRFHVSSCVAIAYGLFHSG